MRLTYFNDSDTTSTSLVHTLYELALHPKDVEKIRQELLDAGVDCAANVQDQRLKHLKHLNGVINEALRLHSPIPTLLQRITPPGGMMIGDTFVPGQTTVWCPQYVVGRCKSPIRVAEELLVSDMSSHDSRKSVCPAIVI